MTKILDSFAGLIIGIIIALGFIVWLEGALNPPTITKDPIAVDTMQLKLHTLSDAEVDTLIAKYRRMGD